VRKEKDRTQRPNLIRFTFSLSTCTEKVSEKFRKTPNNDAKQKAKISFGFRCFRSCSRSPRVMSCVCCSSRVTKLSIIKFHNKFVVSTRKDALHGAANHSIVAVSFSSSSSFHSHESRTANSSSKFSRLSAVSFFSFILQLEPSQSIVDARRSFGFNWRKNQLSVRGTFACLIKASTNCATQTMV
jgi:hypothetical protein